MSHTPGPWVVDKTNALGAYGVWTDYATHPGHDGAGYPTQICDVISLSFRLGDTERRAQRDANANLIAAAPDLLAACRKAVEFIVNGCEYGYIRLPADGDTALDTLPMLRAALAKAEGT